MDSDNKKVSGKFFSNLKPREVASFWFAISLTLLLPVTSLFTPHNQLLVGVGISVVLMFVIIWNGLSLAKSNAESSKSFERLRAALANLNDGVISYDHNFKILSINGAAQQIFGVNGQEVVGQYFGPEKAQDPKFRLLTQVIFPSLAPLVVKRSENDEYPQIVDISFNEPEVYFMVTTIKIGDIETQEFMKIIHDRTREIQLYQSKSEFITIAAHQLRTPLTAINWAFESMGKDYSPSPSEKETIKNGLIASTKA
ncbi:MAG: PAS domain-containing protein, partial [Candidatus Colwellbacteria bacterium]|nr:PAS domain-containing protein [Candidatus Colwellbacteria bacterium]